MRRTVNRSIVLKFESNKLKTDVNRPETIASFNGQVSNLKATRLDSHNIALALTGLATPSGELYNAEKPQSTGKVYTSLFVRQWDAYVTENRNAIWYTTFRKVEGTFIHVGPLRNALKGHTFSLESPVPPFREARDFDISANGIVFVAKDPDIDPANYTKTDLYYIPFRTLTNLKRHRLGL